MRAAQDSIPQRRLAYQLALAIDLVMESATVSPRSARLRRANLDVLLGDNPRSAFSKHVLHNVGSRRRRWLLAYREQLEGRAGARASSI